MADIPPELVCDLCKGNYALCDCPRQGPLAELTEAIGRDVAMSWDERIERAARGEEEL